MVRISRLLLNLAAACLFSSSAFAFSPSFSYGSSKVRGVSLGGWLVLEVSSRCHSSLHKCQLTCAYFAQPWITPSLFDNTGNANIVDEWTFGALQNRNTAQQTLTNHWNTWITEADFAAIAAAGCAGSPSRLLLYRGADRRTRETG